MAATCVISVLWFLLFCGLAFGDGGGINLAIGGFGKPLIVRAFVDRIKLLAVLIFCPLWLMLVYAVVHQWLWESSFLAELSMMDFARGLVLHVTCGTAVVLVAVMMGRQREDPPEFGQSVAVQSS